MSDKYIEFLNDLTHKERSIFFYYFVLRIPQEEISKHLRLRLNDVNNICKTLKRHINLVGLKEEIHEAFLFDKE